MNERRPILRLQFERLKRGLSQNTLSQMSGVVQPYISAVESGAISASEASLEKLARALEMSPPAILAEPVTIREDEVQA